MSDETKKDIKEKIAQAVLVLQKVSMGDFSQNLPVPEKEDELTELLVAINLTIDDLREASKTEKMKYDMVMANLSEGVYFIRMSDGMIVYTNTKFEKMFGYGPGELIGQPVSVVNAPTEKTPEETAKEIIESLKKNKEWHGEVKNIKKDGTTFWCYAGVTEFEHPEYGKIWISAHIDITERKKMEEELKAHNEKLEKMNQLMVGRELKMREMKKKIVELEKRANKLGS